MAQRHAQVVVDVEQAGLAPCRLAVGGRGFLGAPLVAQHVAEHLLRLGAAAVEPQRRLAGGDRLVRPAEPVQRPGAVEVIGGRARVAGDRLLDERQRRLRLAGLQGQHAQHVQAVGVRRLGGQDFPVHPLGLVALPGALQADGAPEQRLDRVLALAHRRPAARVAGCCMAAS